MEKGLWVFRVVVKTLIPASFWVVATWPNQYWLAGVMTILTLAYYVLQFEGMGNEK